MLDETLVVPSELRRKRVSKASPMEALWCAHKMAACCALTGVVCGRGRNSTLRFRPSVFAGEIDVLPAERRDMGQEIGR